MSELLEIAAAGQGERMRQKILDLGFDQNYPKHLLPTGGNTSETLLGRIIEQGQKVSSRPRVHTSPNTDKIIRQTVGKASTGDNIAFEVDTYRDGNSFGVFARSLLAAKKRILGASGDHYVENNAWLDLLKHHDSGAFPVTFAVAPTVSVSQGAVFDIADDGKIVSFERRDTTETTPVNIGLYVFEASDLVLSSLRSLGIRTDRAVPFSEPEIIVEKLIDAGLAGAYHLPVTAFNVNSPATYDALVKHTGEEQAA